MVKSLEPYEPVVSIGVSIDTQDSYDLATEWKYNSDGQTAGSVIVAAIATLFRLGLRLGLRDAMHMAIGEAEDRHRSLEQARSVLATSPDSLSLGCLLEVFKDAPPEVEVCGMRPEK